MTIGQRMAEVL